MLSCLEQNGVANMKNRTILDIVEKHAQKQETSKGVMSRSSCMCILYIQPITDKKHVEKNTTRSIE